MSAVVRDWLQQPIEAGDVGVYVTTGRHVEREAVLVVEVRKRVKIQLLTGRRVPFAQPFWVDSSSLALVGAFKSFKPQLPNARP